MTKKISKSEAKNLINEFFKNVQSKKSKDIKKIRKIAMKHNIPLGKKRKRFCKSCLAPYKNPKIRIKKGIKVVTCKECGYTSRWKIKI